MTTAIIVLGHGSRASAGGANEFVYQIAAMVKDQVGHELVEPAIMTTQSNRQTLAVAAAKLVGQGAGQIVIAPLFWSSGLHLSEDIPEEVNRLSQQFPEVKITIASPIGPDLRIAAILLERIQEVGQ